MVDSSALVAILFQEPEARAFAKVIADADRSLMSAVSLLEVSMVLGGRIGTADAWTKLDGLVAEFEIEVIGFDAKQAEAARVAFLRFGKGRHPARLNMGDCASYALAKPRDLPLLFKGDDFLRTDVTRAL